MKNYYYEIEFSNGVNIRREYVSKKIALAIFTAMEHEMILFRIKQVSWGKM